MVDENDKYLRRIDGDSKQDFERLFYRYYQSLVIFSYHFIKNKEAAEDIVQAIFCNLWENRKTIEIESSIKNYLFRATKNSTLNFIRYDARFVRNDKTELIVDDLCHLDPINIDELEIEVIDALNKLTSREREVFLLCYRDSYSYQEIADMLGISKNSVKTLLLRSRKSFGDRLMSIIFIIPFILK